MMSQSPKLFLGVVHCFPYLSCGTLLVSSVTHRTKVSEIPTSRYHHMAIIRRPPVLFTVVVCCADRSRWVSERMSPAPMCVSFQEQVLVDMCSVDACSGSLFPVHMPLLTRTTFSTRPTTIAPMSWRNTGPLAPPLCCSTGALPFLHGHCPLRNFLHGLRRQGIRDLLRNFLNGLRHRGIRNLLRNFLHGLRHKGTGNCSAMSSMV